PAGCLASISCSAAVLCLFWPGSRASFRVNKLPYLLCRFGPFGAMRNCSVKTFRLLHLMCEFFADSSLADWRAAAPAAQRHRLQLSYRASFCSAVERAARFNSQGPTAIGPSGRRRLGRGCPCTQPQQPLRSQCQRLKGQGRSYCMVRGGPPSLAQKPILSLTESATGPPAAGSMGSLSRAYESPSLLRELLAAGSVSPNSELDSSLGWRPCTRRQPTTAAMLSWKAQTKNGETALDLALARNRWKRCQLLLEEGANANGGANKVESTVHAAMTGFCTAAGPRRSCGTFDQHGDLPIHRACLEENVRAAQLLLLSHNPHLCNRHGARGFTPLHTLPPTWATPSYTAILEVWAKWMVSPCQSAGGSCIKELLAMRQGQQFLRRCATFDINEFVEIVLKACHERPGRTRSSAAACTSSCPRMRRCLQEVMKPRDAVVRCCGAPFENRIVHVYNQSLGERRKDGIKGLVCRNCLNDEGAGWVGADDSEAEETPATTPGRQEPPHLKAMRDPVESLAVWCVLTGRLRLAPYFLRQEDFDTIPQALLLAKILRSLGRRRDIEDVYANKATKMAITWRGHRHAGPPQHQGCRRDTEQLPDHGAGHAAARHLRRLQPSWRLGGQGRIQQLRQIIDIVQIQLVQTADSAGARLQIQLGADCKIQLWTAELQIQLGCRLQHIQLGAACRFSWCSLQIQLVQPARFSWCPDCRFSWMPDCRFSWVQTAQSSWVQTADSACGADCQIQLGAACRFSWVQTADQLAVQPAEDSAAVQPADSAGVQPARFSWVADCRFTADSDSAGCSLQIQLGCRLQIQLGADLQIRSWQVAALQVTFSWVQPADYSYAVADCRYSAGCSLQIQLGGAEPDVRTRILTSPARGRPHSRSADRAWPSPAAFVCRLLLPLLLVLSPAFAPLDEPDYALARCRAPTGKAAKAAEEAAAADGRGLSPLAGAAAFLPDSPRESSALHCPCSRWAAPSPSGRSSGYLTCWAFLARGDQRDDHSARGDHQELFLTAERHRHHRHHCGFTPSPAGSQQQPQCTTRSSATGRCACHPQTCLVTGALLYIIGGAVRASARKLKMMSLMQAVLGTSCALHRMGPAVLHRTHLGPAVLHRALGTAVLHWELTSWACTGMGTTAACHGHLGPAVLHRALGPAVLHGHLDQLLLHRAHIGPAAAALGMGDQLTAALALGTSCSSTGIVDQLLLHRAWDQLCWHRRHLGTSCAALGNWGPAVLHRHLRTSCAAPGNCGDQLCCHRALGTSCAAPRHGTSVLTGIGDQLCFHWALGPSCAAPGNWAERPSCAATGHCGTSCAALALATQLCAAPGIGTAACLGESLHPLCVHSSRVVQFKKRTSHRPIRTAQALQYPERQWSIQSHRHRSRESDDTGARQLRCPANISGHHRANDKPMVMSPLRCTPIGAVLGAHGYMQDHRRHRTSTPRPLWQFEKFDLTRAQFNSQVGRCAALQHPVGEHAQPGVLRLAPTVPPPRRGEEQLRAARRCRCCPEAAREFRSPASTGTPRTTAKVYLLSLYYQAWPSSQPPLRPSTARCAETRRTLDECNKIIFQQSVNASYERMEIDPH
uniref:ANK_REP_REGION domain-containing protein n=1 Tax=Macrostomum lignano TaxID=282301 RepID=A0A1I8JMK3_9PLAT